MERLSKLIHSDIFLFIHWRKKEDRFEKYRWKPNGVKEFLSIRITNQIIEHKNRLLLDDVHVMQVKNHESIEKWKSIQFLPVIDLKTFYHLSQNGRRIRATLYLMTIVTNSITKPAIWCQWTLRQTVS